MGNKRPGKKHILSRIMFQIHNNTHEIYISINEINDKTNARH